MKKELIILLYRIGANYMAKSQVEEQIQNMMERYSLRNDDELKNNYIIREIFLPVNEGSNDVKVIYPISIQQTSPQLYDLIDEISARINDNPDSTLNHHWEKIIRELKLKKLE